MTDLRMNAYYYSFGETGVRPIDEILSAVAVAGKAYHHTDCWSEDDSFDTGVSLIDNIQGKANAAANDILDLREKIAQLEAKALLARPESAEPAAAEKAREWRPIETAPKDGTEVILLDGGDSYAGYFSHAPNYWGEIGWYPSIDIAIEHSSHPDNPTHWMPLPSPPAATGE